MVYVKDNYTISLRILGSLQKEQQEYETIVNSGCPFELCLIDGPETYQKNQVAEDIQRGLEQVFEVETTIIKTGLNMKEYDPSAMSISKEKPKIIVSDCGAAIMSKYYGANKLLKNNPTILLYNDVKDLKNIDSFLKTGHRLDWNLRLYDFIINHEELCLPALINIVMQKISSKWRLPKHF